MEFWYRRFPSILAVILSPLALITLLVSAVKRTRRNQTPYSKPVLVVGNITVGGTGKTPTIIWLVRWLQAQGYRPAVVSRGYGARTQRSFPVLVDAKDTAETVGDEPKLIQLKTLVPVVIDPNRHRAVNYLCQQFRKSIDVIISDDGMQHYAMHRDIELLLIDGQRGFGNRLLIPAGPLRELPSRCDSVDFVLSKGFSEALTIDCEIGQIDVQLAINGQGQVLDTQKVVISSGIGNFQSFQQAVQSLGYQIVASHEFADHKKIRNHILENAEWPIIVTEKDYVKLKQPADHIFYLPFALNYSAKFQQQLKTKLEALTIEKSHHHTRSL